MDYKSQLLKLWLPIQGWVVALLTLISAIWFAQVTWLIIDPAKKIEAPRVQATSSDLANSGPNWSQISNEVARREFFGEVVVQKEEPVDEPVEAPETTLSLTLLAVMAEGDGEGYAIVSQRSGAGKVFAIGDDMFGQAVLANVYGDRIIIDRRGQKETLRYVKIDSGSILQSVDNSPESEQTDSSVSTFQDALSQANEAVAAGSDMASQVQGMVDYVSRRANEDPEGFVREMGLEPTDGGYQVTRQARQLQMVGLRPGDVVTAVNDMPVGNIHNDQNLLNQIMQTGGEIKIQIRRGSRSFTIYQSIPTY